MSVVAVHRDPFSVAPNVYRLPEGVTLADMARRVRTLPEGWPRHEHDIITINGQAAPQALWGMMRPKPGVEVGFHAPPMGGGGGGGGKQVFALVASIALVAISGGITSGALLGNLTGAAAAGKATFLSRLIGGAVLIGGSMALTALAPTPSAPQISSEDGGRNELGSASAQGNALDPNGDFPRVVGTRKIFPRYASEPLSYYDGQDEVVEAVVGLAGPHKLEDIRIAGARIENMSGVDYETREGWPGYTPLALLERYARTNPVQTELRGFITKEDAANQLDSPTSDLADAMPQAKTLSTRPKPDEFWIDLNFPQGVFLNNADNKLMRVPFRMRIREKGTTTWRNLPELHFAAAYIGEKRASIHVIWRDEAATTAAASTGRGWVEGRVLSPGQDDPDTPDWIADSYFTAGTGDDYISGSNAATSRVANVFMSEHEAEISLDRAEFPPGQYEIEIKRGYAFQNGNYNSGNYHISGKVRDPFHYEGGGTISQTRDKLSDKVMVVRGISVWNQQPVRTGNLALIAIKARNVNIENLSVLASGYVRDIGVPDGGMSPSSVFNQGDTIPNGAVSRSHSMVFSVDVDIPESPLGVLWEQGAKVIGSYLGFNSAGNLVWRCGDGGSPPHLSMARIEVPIQAGRRVTIYGEVNMGSHSIRLWVKDRESGGVHLIGQDSSDNDFSEWAGTNSGKVGAIGGGDMVAGESGDDFNGTIHELRIYDNATVPSDDVRGWEDWTTTSNPAPHMRDVLGGTLNALPVPDEIIDDAGLAHWRAACAANGYTVDAICEGMSLADVANMIAGAGYAKPYQSEIWGVVRDYDRSGEGPVQVFSPHNMNNFKWSRGFAKRPDGFRITFADADQDYETRQIIHPYGAGLTEQVSYDAYVSEADCRARAEYDLITSERRTTFYDFDAPAEAIKCRRGDLIYVQHDMLSAFVGSGRIVDLEYDASGNVEAIRLDNEPPAISGLKWSEIGPDDWDDIDDMSLIEQSAGVILRGQGVSVHACTVSGDRLALDTPAQLDDLGIDDLAVIGPLNSEARRLIVFSMQPREELVWTITAVDEAPEIWA